MSTQNSTVLTVPAPTKAIHVTLWVVQGLLAAAFLGAGVTKLTTPLETLVVQMPWFEGAMGRLVPLIGSAEVAAALGLILPSATRIKPRLTALAALGLVLIMAGAIATHAERGEWPNTAVNLILGGMAAFVAWGRSKQAPIGPR